MVIVMRFVTGHKKITVGHLTSEHHECLTATHHNKRKNVKVKSFEKWITAFCLTAVMTITSWR